MYVSFINKEKRAWFHMYGMPVFNYMLFLDVCVCGEGEGELQIVALCTKRYQTCNCLFYWLLLVERWRTCGNSSAHSQCHLRKIQLLKACCFISKLLDRCGTCKGLRLSAIDVSIHSCVFVVHVR